MTTWNHRLVEVKDGDDTILMICEVFYDAAGVPITNNDGARASGANTEELRKVLDRMATALEQPVLKEVDFTGMEPEPTDDGHEMTVGTLVNELVEQGKFLKRDEIDETQFIVNVNHLIDQFVYGGAPAKPLEAVQPMPEARLERNITYAPQDKVLEYRDEVARILEALGHPEALVTDESTFHDFSMGNEDEQAWLEEHLKSLGLSVEPNANLWKAAAVMRAMRAMGD